MDKTPTTTLQGPTYPSRSIRQGVAETRDHQKLGTRLLDTPTTSTSMVCCSIHNTQRSIRKAPHSHRSSIRKSISPQRRRSLRLSQDTQKLYPTRRLYDFHGLGQRLPPPRDSIRRLQISGFRARRRILPVPCAPFRALHRTTGVHQGDATAGSIFTLRKSTRVAISGRLSIPRTDSRLPQRVGRHHRSVAGASRFTTKPGKRSMDTNTAATTSRNADNHFSGTDHQNHRTQHRSLAFASLPRHYNI